MTSRSEIQAATPSANEVIFDARNLIVLFSARHGSVTALDNVSLQIRPGEAIGVIGESGSGKSTLVRTLLGLVTPAAGTVLYRGRDIYAMKQLARFRMLSRDAAMVFQDPRSSLNPRLSVGAVIRDPMSVLRTCPRRQRDARVADLLESVGLSRQLADRPVRALSGGQLQRVAIARALAVEPSVMFADEPTSALDMSVQGEVLNLLRGLMAQHRLALLLVSHDMRVIRFMSDWTVVMRNGEIVEAGPADVVLETPQHEYTRSLLAAAPRLAIEPNATSRLT
ncbi:ABC transporter ATP-binding protein [Jiangella gansuensis]|uniref:ABC transporter ATP-binding protein n=1 Tax=Jiangella gansuensis TaxID=281473 RepID=UPI0004B74A86|nr:ATP-binding cassette domain-containing protein [Jiangella gansuensis]